MDLNGRVRSIVGKDGFCNIRFQGQVYDDDIQLCYNRFRWYDDLDGRYISKDPIGLESREANFYSYVGDSNGWVDVFGLGEGSYRPYQIHSPGYDDIVTKGLHFYGKGGVELSIRPDSNGGITFRTPFSTKNLSASGKVKLKSAIKDAEKKFANDIEWRKSIKENASEAKRTIINSFGKHGKNSDLARGRAAELHFIDKNII
ncbi:RHS repeat-associated core domain-containing protein [Tenacibaculum maritimum]|uniref:RHS repeat domain-containing protein n=1 Tax=Tenacibaculum maritimum TaxID=107401 RepID=UPI0038764319